MRLFPMLHMTHVRSVSALQRRLPAYGRDSLEYFNRRCMTEFGTDGHHPWHIPVQIDVVHQVSSRPAAHDVKVSAPAHHNMRQGLVHEAWSAEKPSSERIDGIGLNFVLLFTL